MVHTLVGKMKKNNFNMEDLKDDKQRWLCTNIKFLRRENKQLQQVLIWKSWFCHGKIAYISNTIGENDVQFLLYSIWYLCILSVLLFLLTLNMIYFIIYLIFKIMYLRRRVTNLLIKILQQFCHGILASSPLLSHIVISLMWPIFCVTKEK